MRYVYYEFLKRGKTIKRECYQQQLMKFKRAIAEKCPEIATRHEVRIFHHENAQLQNCLKIICKSAAVVLPYPRSDLTLAERRTGIRFTIE